MSDESNYNNLQRMRHSAAHLLASAVKELYPQVKLGIGPAIEDGFYYDFDFSSLHSEQVSQKISEEDLAKIEEKMREIQKRGDKFEKSEISIDKAKEIFQDQPYKLELISAIQKGELDDVAEPVQSRSREVFTGEGGGKPKNLSIYRHGNFVDLCRGSHVGSTKDIGAFKLLSVAGAYWRGSEQNPMLTRIYGTVFPTQKELDGYLQKQEEAKKRDHRRLGKQLEIYLYSDLVGPGLPLYLPNGTVIIEEIQDFMRELQREMGYGHVFTPHLAKEDLFQTSGHLQWFAEGMYPPIEFEGEGRYFVKPMNCPFHIQIYKSELRSYRDLPIRYAEFGTVYRYEKSGEIGGLLRTRGFTQDDAHIFCREDQVVDEFVNVFEFTRKLLTGLGLLDHWHRLSLRGEEKSKYAGNDKQWEKATQLIREALQKAKIDYKEAPGEAAFYGPKLDIIFNDSLGREWQISTIQIDFLLPERFDLSYINDQGEKERPYMIHRAPLGSRERILAVLLEHHMGNFPVWLSPVQAVVIPVAERHNQYAQKVADEVVAATHASPADEARHAAQLPGGRVRVEIDNRNQTLPARIRSAQLQKVPYMLIVGEKEEKAKTVSVRLRTGEDLGQQKLRQFKERLHNRLLTRALSL